MSEMSTTERLAANAAATELEDITANGERVTHLQRDNCYYAHRSIYRFALQFCRDATVLDAGCGAGYGAAYLADSGARAVYGIDVSETAIAFSQRHFRRPNLQFQVMDLAQITGLPDQYFDLIFSSNTLEHVPDVQAFLRAAWRLLKPAGTLIVAVPPITNDHERAINQENPYHLNIWSPRQWHATIGRYFADVQTYGHGFGQPGVVLDFGRTPEQASIDERDFVFEPVSIDQIAPARADAAGALPTLTAIFVACRQRDEAALPPPGSPPLFVDRSFTSAPEDKALQQRLQQRIDALEAAARQAELTIQRWATTAGEMQRYIQRLEETLQRKDHHITHLEAVIRRLESGRVMRLLRLLDVCRRYVSSITRRT